MSHLLVTGASGFLGREVVAEALRQGHRVRAQVRRPDGSLPEAVEQVVADLRIDDLTDLASGIDAVLHLAAAKGGDFHGQYAATVRGTVRLLDAAPDPRFVLCSSFAVYAYGRIPAGSLVEESAPLDDDNESRDAYAQTKIMQERLVRRVCDERGQELVVLRPGVVYGRRNWWTYRVGERFGRFWLALGNGAELPLVHVEDCARAMVLAAEEPVAAGATYNVLAPDQPSQREFRRALAEVTAPTPVVFTVPWAVARTSAWAVSSLAQRSSSRWKLPDFVVPDSLAVRAKPFRYSSAPLVALGWRPKHDWRTDLATEDRR